MMRKNHSSLTATVAAAVLMLGSASSWAIPAPLSMPRAILRVGSIGMRACRSSQTRPRIAGSLAFFVFVLLA